MTIQHVHKIDPALADLFRCGMGLATVLILVGVAVHLIHRYGGRA